MNDEAASHQPGHRWNCHRVLAADEDHDIGSQLPAVVVTVVLMQMHYLPEDAGYCQRTMLACQTWTAAYVARTVSPAAANQVATPGVLLHE